MRAEILEVQNNAIDLFNAINSDDDFDIRCRRETPLGSYIPRRNCRPRFVDRIESSATQIYLQGNGYFSPRAEIRHHQQLLEEHMRTLIEENPQLYEAMHEYYVYHMVFDGERIKHMTKIWNDSISMEQLGWS